MWSWKKRRQLCLETDSEASVTFSKSAIGLKLEFDLIIQTTCGQLDPAMHYLVGELFSRQNKRKFKLFIVVLWSETIYLDTKTAQNAIHLFAYYCLFVMILWFLIYDSKPAPTTKMPQTWVLCLCIPNDALKWPQSFNMLYLYDVWFGVCVYAEPCCRLLRRQ